MRKEIINMIILYSYWEAQKKGVILFKDKRSKDSGQ